MYNCFPNPSILNEKYAEKLRLESLKWAEKTGI